MDWLYWLAVIPVLGILILVHEFGHFLAAKAVGVGVVRFSIGFGPITPLRFQRGETEYALSWVPLGGYVKMASKEEQEAVEQLEGGAPTAEFPPHKLFESKSVPARMVVISAGVIMNVVFAWAVYTALAATVGRFEDPTTTIAWVDQETLPEAAAALAELPPYTEVVRVNGQPVASWNTIVEGIIDPTTDQLRLDFAAGVDPVVLPIPGTETKTRGAIVEALVRHWEPRVGSITAGQPAAAAGLERGDLIVAAGGAPITTWQELVRAVEERVDETLVLTVERHGAEVEIAVVPAAQSIRDPLSGEPKKVGRIGISPDLEWVHVRFGPLDAMVEGGRQTWSDTGLVLFVLKSIFLGRISPREVGGPILIGQMSGQVAQIGLLALVSFTAMLSVNLAILNLLPIPVLDGGHLVFLVLEGIRRRPLSLEVRHRLTQVGLFVLLGLMILVLGNDTLRCAGL